MSSRLGRITGLIRKETLQILRDPSSMLIAGVLPILLLFLYGFGVSLDLRNIPIAIVIEQPTPDTASFAQSFLNSRFFHVRIAHHRAEVEDELVAGRLRGIVVLREGFPWQPTTQDAHALQVLVDGSDPNTAGLVQNYVQGVWSNWLQQQAVARGQASAPPVTAATRVWFNPELNSHYSLIPGSIAIIMALIGTLLTALVVAREWERGTMEALMATPVGAAELLIGKIVPYFVLGMLAMALSVLAAVFLFGVPFRGSVLWLIIVSAAFLCPMLALGLLISTLNRNQFAASQTALMSAYLPAFLLSGFIFEISSMPWPIQLITYIMPARYYVSCLQTLFLTGTVLELLIPNTLAMLAIAALIMFRVLKSTRLRLE